MTVVADTAPSTPPGTGWRTHPVEPAPPLAWRILSEPFRARTWREVAYLVANFVLGCVGAAYVFFVGLGGALLVVTVVGLPLIGLAIVAARGFGRVQRWLIEELLHETIPAPRSFRAEGGSMQVVRAALTDATGWKALAYMALKVPLAVTVGFGVGIWVSTAGFLITQPLWWLVLDPEQTDAGGQVRRSIMQLGDFYVDTWPRLLGGALIGLVMAFIAPWLVRLVATGDRLLARGLLGQAPRDAELDRVKATRTRAVVGADERLRQIERDLHDGAQARIAAIAMGLGQVQEDLDAEDVPIDRERMRRLVASAHANSMTAIGELRDLARGIHPPVLDLGLGPDLTNLAATNAATELRLSSALPRFPADIESVVYFCASELMANVARHSGARNVVLDLAVLDGSVDGRSARLLRLQVTDDGHGGAEAAPGSGLSGLVDRLSPLDGRLLVTSPPGGPTAATVDVPLRDEHHG